MDDLGTGVITKLTDGRFDNQYDVEITLTDGTVLGEYDGISVYEKKRDGSESKVWPLVQQSKFQGVPFHWQGNIKESETKAGLKTYATIVWAQPAEDVGGGGNGVGAGEVAGNTPVTTPADDWTAPVNKAAQAPPQQRPQVEKYGGKKDQDDVQRNIIASWAITNAIRMGHRESEKVHEVAHQLIILKDRIAAELAE